MFNNVLYNLKTILKSFYYVILDLKIKFCVMTENLQLNEPAITFCDQVFLSTFGLTQSNVFNYFELSPFYDKRCLNEVCKRHGLPVDQMRELVGFFYESSTKKAINEKTGEEEFLFIIKKKLRHSIKRVDLVSTYYIVLGVIYSCPNSLSTLLFSQVKNSLFQLGEGLKKMEEDVSLDPNYGYVWESDPSHCESKNRKEEEVGSTESTFSKLVQHIKTSLQPSASSSIITSRMTRNPNITNQEEEEEEEEKGEPPHKKTKR